MRLFHITFRALRFTIGLILGLHAAQLSAEGAVTSFTLDNGMDVVVIEDHRAPVVVHMVWYRAGAADETPGSSGVAHFLEHLLFQGTSKRAPGEFSRIVSANGGSDNAFTSQDYTAYFQRVAADRLELMMEMEADRMVDLQLSADKILTERDVIIEERNQRTENSPAALLNEQVGAALYLNHPYGTPVIGWRHEMVGLDLDDALAYYRRFYAPNNAILVVAGDVWPDDVHRMAMRHYGPLPPNPDLAPRQRVEEPPQLAERRLIFEDPRIAQPFLTRRYLVPERDPGAQEEAAALTLLAEILGGDGTNSVLARRMTIESQLAVYAGAYYRGMSLDDTSFGLTVVPTPGTTLEQAEAELDNILADFIETGPDAEHLARLKAQLHAAEIYALDSVQAQADRYGRALTSGLTLADVETWAGVLQAVTAEDIVAAARTYLDKRSAVTSWARGEAQ